MTCITRYVRGCYFRTSETELLHRVFIPEMGFAVVEAVGLFAF